MANATGDGYIYQAQLGDLNVTTAGDGTFGDIQKVNVTETGGAAATIEVSALNLDKTGEWDFGSHLADTDDDDELESVEHTEKKTGGAMDLGAKDASGLTTLGSELGDATLHDLDVEMVESADEQPDDIVYANFTKDASVESGDCPGYYGTVTLAVRMTDKSAYDLSSANGVLHVTQTFQEVVHDRILRAAAVGDEVLLQKAGCDERAPDLARGPRRKILRAARSAARRRRHHSRCPRSTPRGRRIRPTPSPPSTVRSHRAPQGRGDRIERDAAVRPRVRRLGADHSPAFRTYRHRRRRTRDRDSHRPTCRTRRLDTLRPRGSRHRPDNRGSYDRLTPVSRRGTGSSPIQILERIAPDLAREISLLGVVLDRDRVAASVD